MYKLASTTWGNEELEVANKLLASNNLTMGNYVKNFESSFAEYIGTKYAVMFNSGSSANLALISALRYVRNSAVQDGDNIIVPAVSWSTTYYPITQNNLILNFVDVDVETLNIDVDKVEKSINSKTKAIFAVNLLGNPSNLIRLRGIADKYELILIEDNCESLGASINGKMAGSFGEASTHSFFFSHHICTMEGGMVNTNSKELMETLISLRAHGWTRGLEKNNSVHTKSENDWEDLYRFVLPGYNLRPTELSGAIGLEQLSKFPIFLKNRRENAKHFIDKFTKSENYRVQLENGNSSWFGFSIVLQNKLLGMRKEIISLLSENDIETRPIVAGNFTRNPVMKHLSYLPIPELPVANLVHDQGFFIGNHHFDVSKDILRVYSLLREFELGRVKGQ
jgi:CDP-6-deoxy-D-xylo-4-hexulose-3-dehydrase